MPLPLPPTSAETGDRAGIWAAPGSVGMIWASCLRFYARALEAGAKEKEYVAGWQAALLEEPQDRVLIGVRGHIGIGREDTAAPDDAAALVWLEGGSSLELVWPDHTLNETRALAEAITFIE